MDGWYRSEPGGTSPDLKMAASIQEGALERGGGLPAELPDSSLEPLAPLILLGG